jgi:hypothetical protein
MTKKTTTQTAANAHGLSVVGERNRVARGDLGPRYLTDYTVRNAANGHVHTVTIEYSDVLSDYGPVPQHEECDCQAFRFHHSCKHVTAVEQWVSDRSEPEEV